MTSETFKMNIFRSIVCILDLDVIWWIRLNFFNKLCKLSCDMVVDRSMKNFMLLCVHLWNDPIHCSLLKWSYNSACLSMLLIFTFSDPWIWCTLMDALLKCWRHELFKTQLIYISQSRRLLNMAWSRKEVLPRYPSINHAILDATSRKQYENMINFIYICANIYKSCFEYAGYISSRGYTWLVYST